VLARRYISCRCTRYTEQDGRSLAPRPMRLARRPEPFDRDAWVFEPSMTASVRTHISEDGKYHFIFRQNHAYKSFPDLCAEIVKRLKAVACDS
jgi:hypothetical protein